MDNPRACHPTVPAARCQEVHVFVATTVGSLTFGGLAAELRGDRGGDGVHRRPLADRVPLCRTKSFVTAVHGGELGIRCIPEDAFECQLVQCPRTPTSDVQPHPRRALARRTRRGTRDRRPQSHRPAHGSAPWLRACGNGARVSQIRTLRLVLCGLGCAGLHVVGLSRERVAREAAGQHAAGRTLIWQAVLAFDLDRRQERISRLGLCGTLHANVD